MLLHKKTDLFNGASGNHKTEEGRKLRKVVSDCHKWKLWKWKSVLSFDLVATCNIIIVYFELIWPKKFREIHVLGILVGGYKHEVTTFLLPPFYTVYISIPAIWCQIYKKKNADEVNHHQPTNHTLHRNIYFCGISPFVSSKHRSNQWNEFERTNGWMDECMNEWMETTEVVKVISLTPSSTYSRIIEMMF